MVRIFRTIYGRSIVIRLNVGTPNSSRLIKSGFWPIGVICRPWLTRNTYQNQFHNNGRENDNAYDVYDLSADVNIKHDMRNGNRRYDQNWRYYRIYDHRADRNYHRPHNHDRIRGDIGNDNYDRYLSQWNGHAHLGNEIPAFLKGTDRSADKVISLRNVLDSMTGELTNAGVSEPEESVKLIVSHVYGKKMIHEVDPQIIVTEEIRKEIHIMCQKRLNRVPVQYIIGEWDFHDLTLKMELGVLIPRPETEELGSLVVSNLMEKGTKPVIKVLDIGCGTGALSLYILSKLSKTRCVAMDKNHNACHLTLKNAEIHSLQDRIQVIYGDIFAESCIQKLQQQGPFDLIVSNPPYIPAKDMEDLQDEVAGYEDPEALCGGEDGLDVVLQILKISKLLLEPQDGYLWLEVDLSHPVKINHLVKTSPEFGLEYLETISDFTSRGRFCKLKILNKDDT